jgi:hypothetical protein
MKLRELLNNLNKALNPIKDRKFDLEDEECWNTVKQLIKPIINNTELQHLIKDEESCISLYKEEDIDTFHGGEPIIYRHYNCNSEIKKNRKFQLCI